MSEGKIFVISEYKKNQNVFKDVSFELLGAAQDLRDEAKKNFNLDYKVCAVVLDSGIDADFCQLSKYGAQEIIYLKNKRFKNYDCINYSCALVELIKLKSPDIVLFGATDIFRELAPLVTSKLQTGLTADCTALSLTKYKGEIKLAATRPTFGGQLMATILCKTYPQMATVRPKVFKVTPDDMYVQTEFINCPVNIDLTGDRYNLLNFEKTIDSTIDELDSAQIIVAGGKGMKNKDGFELLKKFADKIGAKTAASRGAVEMGLAPSSIQVGQTGKTVAPKIYIACGISGAIQHTVGMTGAEHIIAINKDENAPIFEIADTGIVGDVFEILKEYLTT